MEPLNDDVINKLTKEPALQDMLASYHDAIEQEFMLTKSKEDDPQLDEELEQRVKRVLIKHAPELMLSAIQLAVSPSVKDVTRASMTKWLLELLMSKRDWVGNAPEKSELDVIIEKLQTGPNAH